MHRSALFPTSLVLATLAAACGGGPGEPESTDSVESAATFSLAFSPSSHAFGTVADGSIATSTFTLTNTGKRSTGAITTSLGGSGAADFKVTADTCGASLAPKGTCSVTVAFEPPAGASGAVSARLTASSTSGAKATASLTGTASRAAGSYRVGGTITGLSGTGLELGDGVDTVSASGPTFEFPSPLATGSNYDVTVVQQPTNPSQTCIVQNGIGTVGTHDVTDVTVSCSTNAYVVHADVSGLSGRPGLVLLNGGDSLPVASDGTVSFPTPVPSGSAYQVSIAQQPLGETCTVEAPSSGIIGSSDVTVPVVCQPALYTLTATLYGLQSGGGGAQVGIDGASYAPSGNVVTTQIPAYASYSVAMAVQPSGQTCVPETATSGTMTGNVSISFNCEWNMSVTVYNGYRPSFFAAPYVPCASLPFTLTEKGPSSLVYSHDGATVTASGTSTLTFPSFPGVPQGGTVSIGFAGGAANASGVCNCTTEPTNLYAECQSLGCAMTIYQSSYVSSPVAPTVYCGWIPIAG